MAFVEVQDTLSVKVEVDILLRLEGIGYFIGHLLDD